MLLPSIDSSRKIQTKVISCLDLYVTGYWKTNQIVTLGLFHSIGQLIATLITLHIHSAITRLG